MTKEKVNELCEQYVLNPTDKGFMRIIKELDTLKFSFLSYFKIHNFRSLEPQEFDQVFSIGVWEGIRRFDSKKGTYFSSIFCYARKEIQKFLYGYLVGSKMKYQRKEELLSEIAGLESLICSKKTPEKVYLEKEFLTCLGQFAEFAIGEKEAVIQYLQGDIKGARKVKKTEKSLTKLLSGFFTTFADTLRKMVID